MGVCDDCICDAGPCAFVDKWEQPYFQAFRLARRLPIGSSWRGADFLIWIGRQWGAWRALNGLGLHTPVDATQRQSFQAWLFERVSHPEAA